MPSIREIMTVAPHESALQDSEQEAIAWLHAHPALNGTTALFSTCLNLPYMLDMDKLREEHTKYVANCERMLQNTFSVDRQGETLLPLPPAEVECACADLGQLSVQRIHLSGSVREGTDVRLFMSDVSDTDAMFQLGPVTIVTGPSPQWLIRNPVQQLPLAVGERAHYHYEEDEGDDYDRDAMNIDRQYVDQNADETEEVQLLTVTLHATENPGYVLLRYQPRPDCRHRLPLLLSSSRVVSLISSFTAVLTPDCSYYSGPSAAAMFEDFTFDSKSIDLVACVVCPCWPCEDFVSRPRPSGQPSAELVQRLCVTPVFLVPVGYPGSATEKHQWRLSFSRHEYIVYRCMTETQRAVLSALKHCRAVVGKPAKPVKSFYLKTALMWLCEERPKADWNRNTFYASLLLVLRYIEVCTRRGFMPLYFWPEVNLLSGRSPAELAELASAVGELRARLLSASLAMVAQWIRLPVCELATRLLLAEQLFTTPECTMTGIITMLDEIKNHNLSGFILLKNLFCNGKLPLWKQIMPLPLYGAHRPVFTSMLRRLTDGMGGEGAVQEVFMEALSLIFPATKPLELSETNEDSWLTDEH